VVALLSLLAAAAAAEPVTTPPSISISDNANIHCQSSAMPSYQDLILQPHVSQPVSMSLSNACENPQLTAFDVEIKTQKYKCSLSINWYRKHILPVKIKKNLQRLSAH